MSKYNDLHEAVKGALRMSLGLPESMEVHLYKVGDHYEAIEEEPNWHYPSLKDGTPMKIVWKFRAVPPAELEDWATSDMGYLDKIRVFEEGLTEEEKEIAKDEYVEQADQWDIPNLLLDLE